jgi:methylenetetrahydrofolate--tRNA-(uracil-5-)-methyltransferase
MNINFGLFPPLQQPPAIDRDSRLSRSAARAFARKRALTQRALADLDSWIAGELPAAAAE